MSLIKKLLSFLSRREKLKILGLLFDMSLSACLEAFGLGILISFLMVLKDPALFFSNRHVSKILHFLGTSSEHQALLGLSIFLVLFYVGKNLYLVWLYRMQFRFIYSKQTALSKQLLATYLHKPYTFHLTRNTAELLKNVTDEVHAVCHNVVVPLLLFTSEMMVVAIIVGTLLVVDAFVALVTASLIGGLGWLFLSSIQNKLKSHGEAKQGYLEQMIKWVNQSLGSLKEIKVLGKEQLFVDTYGASIEGFGNAFYYVAMAHQLPRLFIETIAVTCILMTTIIIQWEGKSLADILPLLGLFGMAAVRLVPSMGRIASMLTMLRYYRPAVDIVYNDLEPVSLLPSRKRMILPLDDSLELSHLSYRYPEAQGEALKDVSLNIKKGTSLAFVGPSGSGKTTLIDLILGILKPTSGEIKADGRNIHEDLRGWQDNIGYIPQMTYLLDDTIKRNVALGLTDEEIDETLVLKALQAAQMETFVQSLPRQLDTIVGERGSRLSGGERQRLGIARALYYDPKILIMDEPTSSLDYATESEIIQAINTIKGKKTILVVAHRLSTVKNCDEIYMVKEGQLSGPHHYENIVSLSRVVVNES